MIFQDNIIKQHLKNVYFITGTPCGGKTTVSKALGERFGIPVYDIDRMFPIHQLMSDEVSQPAMNRSFKDADEFFGRSVREYREWLINNTAEQLGFVLLDLIKLSQDGIVLCDCHLTLEQAQKLTDPSRIAFFIKEPVDLVDEYCSRSDHKGFCDFIHSASDIEKAKATCNETLHTLNEANYTAVKNSGYFWIDRSEGKTVAETVRLTAEHFGWLSPDEVNIEKVNKGTALEAELLRFVENCSWDDTKQHISEMIRNHELTDWETMFAAIVDGKIVGMASALKTDYYPLPEITPWVSCIFVSEGYRGHRISEKLISHANSYLKELGFERSYIPSVTVGLYELYGYRYLKDITNYGGGTDHLFFKDLK